MPFNVVDKGPDNVTGTADDQNLTFYGIPNSIRCSRDDVDPTDASQS